MQQISIELGATGCSVRMVTLQLDAGNVPLKNVRRATLHPLNPCRTHGAWRHSKLFIICVHFGNPLPLKTKVCLAWLLRTRVSPRIVCCIIAAVSTRCAAGCTRRATGCAGFPSHTPFMRTRHCCSSAELGSVMHQGNKLEPRKHACARA